MVPSKFKSKSKIYKDQGPVLEQFDFKRFLNNDKISFTQNYFGL